MLQRRWGGRITTASNNTPADNTPQNDGISALLSAAAEEVDDEPLIAATDDEGELAKKGRKKGRSNKKRPSKVGRYEFQDNDRYEPLVFEEGGDLCDAEEGLRTRGGRRSKRPHKHSHVDNTPTTNTNKRAIAEQARMYRTRDDNADSDRYAAATLLSVATGGASDGLDDNCK